MQSLFDLTGKTAIVTGSSRGIGRAMAEEMAAHGASVVISSRKQDACEEVAAALKETGAGKGAAIGAPRRGTPRRQQRTRSRQGRRHRRLHLRQGGAA